MELFDWTALFATEDSLSPLVPPANATLTMQSAAEDINTPPTSVDILSLAGPAEMVVVQSVAEREMTLSAPSHSSSAQSSSLAPLFSPAESAPSQSSSAPSSSSASFPSPGVPPQPSASAPVVRCISCRKTSTEKRGLAAHVRDAKCKAAPRRCQQCHLCGGFGDGEWAASHLLKAHPEAYFANFVSHDEDDEKGKGGKRKRGGNAGGGGGGGE